MTVLGDLATLAARELPVVPLSAEDRVALSYAKMLLESPSLAVRLTSMIGEPLERGMRRLPANWRALVERASISALERAAEFALVSLRDDPYASPHDWLHKAAAATSGAIGGAGGIAMLGVELPLSTTIMLRSIAAIARSEGHELKDPEVRLACLEVFALGGTSRGDDATKTGYYAMRGFFAQEVAAAARHLAERGFTDQGAPASGRLLLKLAAW